jgi:hypothetical protein
VTSDAIDPAFAIPFQCAAGTGVAAGDCREYREIHSRFAVTAFAINDLTPLR